MLINESRLWIFMDIRVIAFSVVTISVRGVFRFPSSVLVFSNQDGHKRHFLPLDCSFSSEIHVNHL